MAQVIKGNSALYKLECITDNPKYEGFAFTREKSIRGKQRLSFDFMPDDIPTKGREWTVTPLSPLWTPQLVKGRVRSANDYPCVNMSIPAFSRRAVDALRDFLEPNGELLPLVSKVGEYYAFNITTVADILDHDKSIIQWFDPKKRAIAIKVDRYECKAGRFADLSIFRLVEEPAATFVSQSFVDRVVQAELNGLHLIKLWPLSAGVSWRDMDRTQQKREMRIVTPDGEKSVVAHSVVILFPTAAKATKADRTRIAEILDNLDALLYAADANDSQQYFGSVEGHEHIKGNYRVYLSCPRADALVDRIRSWLRDVKWTGKITVVKRYGAYDNPECREEVVEI